MQDDKLAVPRDVYGRLLEHALNPPSESMILPYCADDTSPARAWVSLLLRPVVVPHVPGFARERSLEVRFFAPGTLVANLDFVEGIFGNGGDPYLPDNDASLKPRGWTGHTGAVILAPHLTKLTKRELGLPHHDEVRLGGDHASDPGAHHRMVVHHQEADPTRAEIGRGRRREGSSAHRSILTSITVPTQPRPSDGWSGSTVSVPPRASTRERMPMIPVLSGQAQVPTPSSTTVTTSSQVKNDQAKS